MTVDAAGERATAREPVVRVGIMQPYFLPYLGYWQLIAAVDRFVVYDDIQYTKKGWINRNRFLRNGAPTTFSLPLRSAPEGLEVRQRTIADTFDPERLLRQWHGAYVHAPWRAEALDLLAPIVTHPARNLFDYLFASIRGLCGALGIPTELVVSSTVPTAPGLRGAARVVATVRALGGGLYLNPIGGATLYDEREFAAAGLALRFHHLGAVQYAQGDSPWVPHLSIVDVLMFNGVAGTASLLRTWEELRPADARIAAGAGVGQETGP